jgi:hypothetical protein
LEQEVHPVTSRDDHPLTMTALIGANLWAKKARSMGIAFAVALAVMTVVGSRRRQAPC